VATNNEEEITRKEYLEERKVLLEGRSNAFRSLEKTLVTLSAGALALSITFLHDIAPQPKQIGWMIASWSLLFISLLLMLIVFVLGVYAYDKDLEAWKAEYEKRDGKRPECLICALQILEWTSLVSFVSGSVLFAIFAVVNLPVVNLPK